MFVAKERAKGERERERDVRSDFLTIFCFFVSFLIFCFVFCETEERRGGSGEESGNPPPDLPPIDTSFFNLPFSRSLVGAILYINLSHPKIIL